MEDEDALREPWFACVQAALALVRQWQGPSVMRTVKWAERKGRRTQTREAQRLYVLRAAELIEFEKMPEMERLRRQICASPPHIAALVKRGERLVKNRASQLGKLKKSIILPALEAFFEADGEDRDENILASIYDYFILSCVTARPRFSLVVYLAGLVGPRDPVKLPNGVILRRLQLRERQQLWSLRESHELAMHYLADTTHCLSREFLGRSGGFPGDLLALLAPMEQTVTALRLMKEGPVGIQAIVFSPLLPQFRRGMTVTVAPDFKASRSYPLSSRETKALAELCTSMAVARLEPQVELAINRFSMSYDRKKPEDSIIDCWVGLEALFLPDDPPQELSYRASLRIAYLLGKTPESREQLFRSARQSYKTRSDIVHGREFSGAHKIAADTEDIVRRTLRLRLTDPNALDVKQIDSRITCGS